MKLPPEILTLLLRGGHLSVEARKAKGLWPNEALKFSEVHAHLADLIRREEWFPRPLPECRRGEPVHEGMFIHRISTVRYICHSRRHSVFDPCIVAEESASRFSRRAARQNSI